MAYDDDMIAALQQAVKQEIIENYFRERRILEEEINILLEDACAWHGGLALWEKRKAGFLKALFTMRARKEFCKLAGITLPLGGELTGAALEHPQSRPRGLTRARRYRNHLASLYARLREEWRELKEERERLSNLREEVNKDIAKFENTHDLLLITSYLRSMDPMELQRRKFLGVNFGYDETSQAAGRLAFRPVPAQRLAMDEFPLEPNPGKQVFARAGEILDLVCRENPGDVDRFLEVRRVPLREGRGGGNGDGKSKGGARGLGSPGS